MKKYTFSEISFRKLEISSKNSKMASAAHRRNKSDGKLLLSADNKGENHIIVENLSLHLVQPNNLIKNLFSKTFSNKNHLKNSPIVEKCLLENIYCKFPRNKLSCIMGPSGAGKTTLLNLISGRTSNDPHGKSTCTKIRGTMKINNQPIVNKNRKGMRTLCGYVAQDDVMMASLTVRENIRFSLDLRLTGETGVELTADQKEQKIEYLINALGLSKCADSRIGNHSIRGVSGGERKRCAIAMEMVTNPKILFLDEPTTGLDASTALSVLQLCKKLSKKMTIIMTIHQPRACIWELFDHAVIMNCQEFVEEVSRSTKPQNQSSLRSLRKFSEKIFQGKSLSEDSELEQKTTKGPGTVVLQGNTFLIQSSLTNAGYPADQYDNVSDHLMDMLKFHKELHEVWLTKHFEINKPKSGRFNKRPVTGSSRRRAFNKETSIDQRKRQNFGANNRNNIPTFDISPSFERKKNVLRLESVDFQPEKQKNLTSKVSLPGENNQAYDDDDDAFAAPSTKNSKKLGKSQSFKP